ncbi:MAG: hypothetical protein JW993_08025 [Sedimentisphaerales bacterium]|nr:hypothetical protein [Sedimentisphaerales bacterium]
MLYRNCTFADNRSPDGEASRAASGRGGPARNLLAYCIIWGLTRDLELHPWLSYASIAYCDVQGGFPGATNLNVDPLFASPGSWKLNGTPDDLTDDLWSEGDYHLKSQAGRWDRATESWVADDVTSPCIDAGDPASPIADEPFPNGGVVNLGAYGGTAEASKSYFGAPVCQTHLAGDINGDCNVDLADLLILVAQWTEGPAAEHPPIAIVEPQNGAVFESSTRSVPIRVEVTDPHFVAIDVRVRVSHHSDALHYGSSFSTRQEADGWSGQWSVPAPRSGAAEHDYTITAEATDYLGRVHVSSPITVTVRQLP